MPGRAFDRTLLHVTHLKSSARIAATAFVLLLFLPATGEGVVPPHSTARAGREVYQELVASGEARVLVTFRRSAWVQAAGPTWPGRSSRLIDEVLEGFPPGSVREEHRLQSVPVLRAKISARGLSRLLADDRVSRIDLDGEIRAADAVSVVQIGADRVQALGFRGQGVTVAVLDSGTDPASNPDLESSLAGEECFCSTGGACCPDGSARQSGPGSAASIANHGPGVIGILSSDGNVAPPGVAPEVRILAVRVLDDALVGTFSAILDALDWVLVNRPDVRLVNLSLAAGLFPANCDDLFAFNEAISQISAVFRSRGGLLFAASGNSGNPFLLGSPACVASVVAVGSVTSDDLFIPFTNANEGLDLLAPGLGVQTTGSFGTVFSFTGTSASTPHAVGAAALLLSADPSLSAQQLEDRLEREGVAVADPRTGISYPRVDAFQSLLIPVELSLDPPAFSARNRGRGLSVRVEPQPPFTAEDLDAGTLTLSLSGGTGFPAEPGGGELGDGDGDGIADLTVRFDRRLLLAGTPPTGVVPVALRGSFTSGVKCEGRATLRILSSAGTGSASEPTP